jgi:predicted nuclease of predicted toxin-antitoxin system
MQNETGMVVKSSYILKHTKLPDKEIYNLAKQRGNVIIISKDADFSALVTQFGSPPKIIKLNSGNMPTKILWDTFGKKFLSAIKVLKKPVQQLYLSSNFQTMYLNVNQYTFTISQF